MSLAIRGPIKICKNPLSNRLLLPILDTRPYCICLKLLEAGVSKLKLLTLVSALLLWHLLVGAPIATAQAPIELTYSSILRGNLLIGGNANLTCDPSGLNGSFCTLPVPAYSNNQFYMIMLDADSDAGTFNSSSYTFSAPTNANTVFAMLYWMGDHTTVYGGGTPAPSVNDFNKVKFKGPSDTNYRDITADNCHIFTGALPDIPSFNCYSDVTHLISADPSGTYWTANIQAKTNEENASAGWVLLIVYSNPSDTKYRSIQIFDGMQVVNPGGAGASSFQVSGFYIPADASLIDLGLIVTDGDLFYGGDRAYLNSTLLGNALNPTNNFFNTSFTYHGSYFSGGGPNYPNNNLNLDIDIIDASPYISPGDVSADLYFSSASGGESYIIDVLTFVSDTVDPDLRLTKTALDLNAGVPEVGDQIEYTLELENTSSSNLATQLRIEDTLAPSLSYVPGSLVIQSGFGSGPQSDTAGDDLGEFNSSLNKLSFNVGTGATSIAGGSLNPGEKTIVTFRATINAGFTEIRNQASAAFYNPLSMSLNYIVSDSNLSLGAEQPSILILNTTPPATTVDSDRDGIPDSTEGLSDADADGLPNYLDIDSDNDGITDTIEAQATATFTAPLNSDLDGDGLDDRYDADQGGVTLVPIDTDNDGTPDYLDTDSDNDGILDIVEGNDSNWDLISDTIPLGTDSDNDGLDDAFDTVPGGSAAANNSIGTNVALPDQDNDGEKDWRDVTAGECADLRSYQFTMDGSALLLKKEVRRAINLRKQSAQSKICELNFNTRNSISQAENLYLDAWSLVWSLPSYNHANCASTTACSTHDYSPMLTNYQNQATSLANLSKEFLNTRCVINHHNSRRKRILARVRKLLNQAIEAHNQYPRVVMTCL